MVTADPNTCRIVFEAYASKVLPDLNCTMELIPYSTMNATKCFFPEDTGQYVVLSFSNVTWHTE